MRTQFSMLLTLCVSHQPLTAHAEESKTLDWRSTDIQVLYDRKFELGPKER